MFKVKLSTFVQSCKIHHVQVTQAARKIEMPKELRKNRKFHETVSVDGSDIWLTYEWQDDQDGTTIMFVRNAKYPKKKRKR